VYACLDEVRANRCHVRNEPVHRLRTNSAVRTFSFDAGACAAIVTTPTAVWPAAFH
jgi:hypothetical protein